MHQTRIHFVCTGNIFRSRLAHAYTLSILPPASSVVVTSSGITANHNLWGPIAWFTQEMVDSHHLQSFISPSWVQTSEILLSSQDIIIFMEEYHQQYCQSHFNYHQSNFQIWNISDIESDMDRRQLRQYSQQVFEIIKQKSKILVSSLL